MDRLQAESRRQQRMIRAEDKAGAKAMGWEISPEAEPEDMGTTILGDVTHPAPVVISPEASGSRAFPMLAAALLGAAIPGAGLGVLALDMLTDKVPAASHEDNTLDIGLRKIEDLK